MALSVIFATEWIIHHTGDYPLQNSWLANNKRYHFWIAFTHSFVYSLPFVAFYLWNPLNPLTAIDLFQWAAIVFSHALIDYFNLGAFWVRLYNWDWKDWRENSPSAPLWVCLQIDQWEHHICNILILSVPHWHDWQNLLAGFQ